MSQVDRCGSCGRPLTHCTCAAEKKGAKYDGDKLRYDLLLPDELEDIVQIITDSADRGDPLGLLPGDEISDIVEVLIDGAKKYAPGNWRRVPNAIERYYAAMMRHIQAWRKGEILDPDSNRRHLSHAACCLLFLMWFDKNKEYLTDGETCIQKDCRCNEKSSVKDDQET